MARATCHCSQRRGLEHDAYDGAVLVEALDAPHLGRLDDDVVELGILEHRRGLLLQDRLHLVEVGLVADRDVEDGACPVLALVADPQHLAVADVPNGAVDIAQPGHAQADRLDDAGGLAEVDDVTDAVLVLEDHEDAGEEVLDEVLGAEAEGDADDAGAGDDRCDVDAQLGQHHDDDDRQDQAGRDALEQRSHGLGALLAALVCCPGAGQHRKSPALRVGDDAGQAALAGASHQPVDRSG